MIFQESNSIWDWFPRSTGWLLVFSGLIFIVWFIYEAHNRGGFLRPTKKEWENPVLGGFIKSIVLLSFAFGLLLLWAGIIGWMNNIPPSTKYGEVTGMHHDPLTTGTLLILGAIMFIKPIKDVPFYAVIGLMVGVISATAFAAFIPAPIAEYYGWDIRKWAIIIGIIVAAVVGMSVKFYTNILEFLAKFFSLPPVALVIAIYCILQGFIIIIGGSTLFLFASPGTA